MYPVVVDMYANVCKICLQCVSLHCEGHKLKCLSLIKLFSKLKLLIELSVSTLVEYAREDKWSVVTLLVCAF